MQIDRYGRTDIQIEANYRWDTSAAKKVTVIIETKGCWNEGVNTAQRTQLADRYLRRDRTAAGIYLVGYFDSPAHWNNNKPGDDGKPHSDRPHTIHTIEDLTAEQHALTEQLRGEKGAEVYAFVLDCRPDPVDAAINTGQETS